MAHRTIRRIIHIDEQRCDGCGLCVPSCHEGAIQIIDGKARLIADALCDGLGDCLGACPRDAIRIEERVAAAYDEALVATRQAHTAPAPQAAQATPATQARLPSKPRPSGPAPPAGGQPPCACPGTALRMRPVFAADASPSAAAAADSPGARAAGGVPVEATAEASASHLEHWPVKLALLPDHGRLWEGRDVLIAADCVGFALANLHARLLAGRTVAIACPKLDNLSGHAEKLERIFASHDVRSITVARMEVPCCQGLLITVRRALQAAGREGIPVRDLMIGADGRVEERSAEG